MTQMSNAKLDQNRIPTLLGTSKDDGVTTIPLIADPVTHKLQAIVASSSDLSISPNDTRDENRKIAFMAVSAVDGVTPVPVYCDSSGRLLIIM